MAPIILDDLPYASSLFPFAEIRSVADIRVGILTIREKWEKITGQPVQTTSESGTSGLSDREHRVIPANLDAEHRLVPANLVPSGKWIKAFLAGEADPGSLTGQEEVKAINYPWDIFLHNDWAIRKDFELICKGVSTHPIPETVQCVSVANIFIEAGARLEFCTLNATAGPIYIGKNAEIMEGSAIRGPFAMCEGAVVKMGSRIYGATTLGPNSVVGGELKNVMIFGNSNKGHDGYLGDSVIGEWCNLGAGTSNSNVKNNAGEVKVWNQASKGWLSAGIKCGLMMGDYSRAAINTSFNTGSVIGICANIFGAGLVPKYVDSFSWGIGKRGNYSFEKAVEHISNWKKLKKQTLTDTEIQRLKHIFEALSKV